MKPDVEYDPFLVEEAVFLALRERPEAPEFHREREPLYEQEDLEERERAFRELYRRWFVRLHLGDPLERALEGGPLLLSSIRRWVVRRAVGEKEEGAELFVHPKEGYTVRLLLRPLLFLDPQALLTLLRSELLHIADMLDPDFGYEPVLLGEEGGAVYDRLLQDRYRTLWNTTVQGRMVRYGWAAPSVRSLCFQEFARTFPMLGDQTLELFSRFFDGERPSHRELKAFALRPAKGPQPAGRCPLCRFPTYAFLPHPEDLPAPVLERIRRDFPGWHPVQGLCLQCGDLYQLQGSL